MSVPPPPEDSPTVPQDLEAETQVIGALLLDDFAIGQVAGLLRPVDFYSVTPRTIYDAMLAVHERQQPTDVSVVRAELEQRNQLEELGGLSVLVSYMTAVPTAVNLLYYAAIVADRAARRRLIKAAKLIAEAAYAAETADAAVNQAAMILGQYSAGPQVGRLVQIGAHSEEVWVDVGKATDAAQEGEVVTLGLETGLPDLDRYGGLRPGELVVLAARPSMGKTSLAVQIADAIAQQNKRVLVFSAEMPGKDIAGRLLWQRTRLDGTRALRGLLGSDDLAKLSDAVGETGTLPLWVDDTAALPVAVLVSRARSFAREHGLGLVVVDYLQLLKGTPRKDGNRVAEVTEISATLKALARDVGCPVLALSQLNRQVEHRASSEPKLSDLRDSGALEQDADQVWLLYREDPENPTATLDVAKNRSGAIGVFRLRFDAPSTRFEPLSDREPSW